MIVHDEAESDTAITPSKDGTLIVRQVLEDPFLALFIVLCVLRFIIHPFLLFVLLMVLYFVSFSHFILGKTAHSQL